MTTSRPTVEGPADQVGSRPSTSVATSAKSRTARWLAVWSRRPWLVVGAAIVALSVLAISGIAVGVGLNAAAADAQSAGGPSSPTIEETSTSGSTTQTPTPTPTKTPQVTKPPVPTTGATPDAPFAVAARPEGVLPVDCSSLVDQGLRTDVLGEAGSLHDTGGPSNDAGVAAEWHAGVLRCIWFNAAQTASIEVEVLPDAVSDFRAFYTANFGSVGSEALGPDSHVACTPASETSVWSCSGGFVASTHWVEFNFGGSRPNGADTAPFALATRFGEVIGAQLDGVPTSRAQLIDDGPRGWSTCDQLDTTGLGSALGSPALAAPVPDVFGLTLTETAWRKTGFGICHWTSTSSGLAGVEIDVLPGGGWSVPSPTAAASQYPTGTTDLVSVDGAEAAVRTCFLQYGQCTVRASVNGSLIRVSTVTSTNSSRDARADVLTAASFLVAHLPS